MRKKIAAFLIALTLISGIGFYNAPQAQASIDIGGYSFSAICALAGGGNFGNLIGEVLSDGVSAFLDTNIVHVAEKWVMDHLDKIPGIGKYLSGLGGLFNKNPVPVGDDSTHAKIQKQNTEEKIKNCAQVILTNMATKYAQNFVKQTLGKHKIGNYLVYSINLANQIYVNHELEGKSFTDQFLIKENINRIIRRSASQIDLRLVYNQRSLRVANFTKTSIADVVKSNAFYVLDDPLVSTPQGQQYLSEAAAQEVYAAAKSAADLQILGGGGSKDQFVCADKSVKCSVSVPAAQVNATIAAKDQALAKNDVQPQNLSSVLGTIVNNYISHKKTTSQELDQMITNGNTDQSNPNNGTVYDDVYYNWGDQGLGSTVLDENGNPIVPPPIDNGGGDGSGGSGSGSTCPTGQRLLGGQCVDNTGCTQIDNATLDQTNPTAGFDPNSDTCRTGTGTGTGGGSGTGTGDGPNSPTGNNPNDSGGSVLR